MNLGVSGDVCITTGKHRHASRQDARAHLRHMQRSFGYKGEEWRCHFCGDWHIGARRMPKSAATRRPGSQLNSQLGHA